MVAIVRSGRRTRRPARRRPSNACGDVTSWTRWRSTKRSVGSPGSSRTTWLSQTFSNSVFGIALLSPVRGLCATAELVLDRRRVEAARGEQHVARKPKVGELLDHALVRLRRARERRLDALLAELLRRLHRP